jgi:hypothetical protein
MIKVDLFLIFFAGEWQLDAFWNAYVQWNQTKTAIKFYNLWFVSLTILVRASFSCCVLNICERIEGNGAKICRVFLITCSFKKVLIQLKLLIVLKKLQIIQLGLGISCTYIVYIVLDFSSALKFVVRFLIALLYAHSYYIIDRIISVWQWCAFNLL